MKTDPKRRFLFGAAAAAAALAPMAAARAATPAREEAVPTRGRYPNVLLTTHRGERVRFYDDVIQGNRIVVLNMMYTQCSEICGGTVVNLARVHRELGERMGRDVFMYSITLDPKHDTPEVLARYAELAGAGKGWTFLTGRHVDIERLRRAIGFVDSDPKADRDLTTHTGMVRAGNDALDRWVSCPGMGPARQLAQEFLWVGMAPRAAA